MDSEGILKSIKSNLKGLVITEKNGYTTKKLREHYKEFIGEDLEKVSAKLGHSSMERMLDSMKDLVRRSYNREGEKVYIGVPDETTRHMAALVGKTPVTKKKKKGSKSKKMCSTGKEQPSCGKTAQGKGVKTVLQTNDTHKKTLEMCKDVDIATDRIKGLVGQMPNGVYSTVLEKQFEKRYKEHLPKLWWKKLEGRNVIKVEPLNQEVMIIYPPESMHEKRGIVIEEFSKLCLRDEKKDNDKITPSVQLIQLSGVTPPKGPYWNVYVTIFKSFQEIFVRFVGEEYSDKFYVASLEMDDYYNDNSIPAVKDVIVEQIYAAQVDGDWHRVQVLDVENGSTYCRFLDHGDEDFVSVKDLKAMHTKFVVNPSQAFLLALHGLEGVDKDEDVAVMVEEKITRKSLIAQVMKTGEKGSLPSVVLFDTSNEEEEINLNQWIIHQLKSKTSDKASSSRTEQKIAKDENGKKESLSDLSRALTPEMTFDVKVMWAASPDNFVVQPLESIHQLENLVAEMTKFYNDPSNRGQVAANSVREGDTLAAKHENGTWYRAKVTRVRKVSSILVVVVFYVDYGEVHATNLDHLQPLVQEFRRLPVLGVRANLVGASPSAGDWTEEEIGWFHDRVVGKEFNCRVGKMDQQVDGEKKVPLVLIDDKSHLGVYKYVVKELFDSKNEIHQK